MLHFVIELAIVRARLSQKTAIPLDRINILYFSTRDVTRKRKWKQIRVAFLLLFFLNGVVYLINSLASRTYVSVMEEEVTIRKTGPLPSDFLN